MEKKLELVFIPCPAPGHIVSTVQFAERLLSHHPQFHVTILLLKSPWMNKPSSPQQQSLESSGDNDPSSHHTSRLSYLDLPEVDLPPKQLFNNCPEDFISTYIASHKPHVRAAAIDAAKQRHTLAGIVVDMFSTSMIDVAHDLNIPSYLFFTSSAAFLGLLLDLPSLNLLKFKDENGYYYTDTDDEFSISTFANPVPTSAFPAAFFTQAGHTVFTSHAKRFAQTKGMILNTFAELEPYAVNSLTTSNTRILPPVYPVGPLLDLKGKAHGQPSMTEKNRIMTWLDRQPDSSVLFLCFGSGGSFSNEQVAEIATGLQQSGVRFLWSLRKPPTQDKVAKPGEYTENEVNQVLPTEFQSFLQEEEEQGGRGLVCGWTPQVEVLAHKAVGGFVSHCGWNSTLESLWFGVPIVAWPLYAEQHSNAFEIVRELGLGVELRLDYKRERGDLVRADEIQKAVKCLMDDHGGNNQVRARVKEVSEISKRALMEDSSGSSFVAMECLVKDIEKNIGG